MGFSCGLVVKTLPAKMQDPVFLPRKPRGQRRLVGYSPWGHRQLNTAEHNDKVPPHQVDLDCFPYDDIQIYTDARLRSLMRAVVASTFTS